jgi:hypothetical protein
MGLDRALGPTYRAGDLLVGVAANDEVYRAFAVYS